MVQDERTLKILKKLDKLKRAGSRKTAEFVADEATTYFTRRKENLEQEEASKDRDLELAEIEKYLGDVHKIMGDHKRALFHYKIMKDLCKDTGSTTFLADAYVAMGEIHKIRGDWDNAQRNFKKALKLAKRSHYEHGEAEASRLVGYVNWRLGSFKKAEDFFKKALHLSSHLNDMHIQGKTYIDLGNLENESGNLDQAQRYYQKALKLLEKVDDKFELARAYNNLGDICMKREDWVAGIKNFEKCHSIARVIRDPRWKGWAMFNAAECYSKSGKPKKAAVYCERAERALSTTEDRMASAYVQINYGIAFRFLKEFDMAEERFKRGLDALEELKSPSTLAWAYTEYARFKKDQGEDDEAMTYLRMAIKMYRKTGAKRFIMALTKELVTWRNR